MRTTVRLDDALIEEVKRYASKRGKTLTAVIADALRQVVAVRHRREKVKAVRLATFRGKGTLPGVDLDQTSSLLDLMESR